MPKVNQNNHNLNIGHVFCLCILGGLFITVIALAITRGALWEELFWHDSIDTGMDFFHSIEYVRGRQPYERWQTLYPPLANLFFYVLYRFVPLEVSTQWTDTFGDSIAARGTAIDLRVTQSTAILFIFFILLTCIALLSIIQKYIGNEVGGFVSITTIFSYGVLYAYERGNIIIIVLICSMFFVFFKDSTNKLIAELSLFMLAIATGMKIYPVFLGFMLLYDKQYGKAVRAVIYGILIFFLPTFAFHEGLGGLKIFCETLFSYAGAETLVEAAEGFSLTQVLASVALMLQNVFGIGMDERFLLGLFPKISLCFVLLLLLCGFGIRKKWQKALLCTVAMALYSYQGDYIVIFLLIPLLVMLKDERVICKVNCFPFIAIIMTQIILPVTGDLLGIWNLNDFRMQICILLCAVYLLKCLFQNIKKNRNS